MPGSFLRDPGPLRDSTLRSRELFEPATAPPAAVAPEGEALEQERAALLETTRKFRPELSKVPELAFPAKDSTILAGTTRPGVQRRPVQGTNVFASPEEFARIQREASTLADPTPLGQFTTYRPGFKADTTLKTGPFKVRRAPDLLLGEKGNVRKQYREAIASIESRGGGDYKAVGLAHPELGRALGRYQMMEQNIGPWAKEALGRALTVEQFLSSPKSQDIIFDHIFSGYVKQFGSPEKAAQAWFGGPGGVGKTERRDVLGTSVGDYGQDFQAELDRLNGR